MRIISLKKYIAILVLTAATIFAGGSQIQASTPVPDSDESLPVFRQIPSADLRTVITTITKETDAAMELTLLHSILNDDVSAVGEIQFRVPEGITIYGSLLGGSGGSGVKIAPFVNDPIKPGGAKVWSFYARSQKVGEFEVVAKVRVWPEGNMDAYDEQDLVWVIQVSEPSEEKDTAPVSPPAQPTQTKTSSGSGGCSIGGKPDASLLLFGLFVPAIGYLGRRKNRL